MQGAISHEQRSIDVVDRRRIMSRHHNGGPRLGDSLEQPEDGGTGDRVEFPSRLISQQVARFMNESPGY